MGIDWGTVLLAIIALLGSVTMAYVTNRQLARAAADRRQERLDEARIKMEEREADWARQDEVADRLAASQAKVAQAAQEVADVAQATAVEQGKKLDTIHTLVNNNLTVAMENELAMAIGWLAASNTQPHSAEVNDAMAALQARIAILQHELAERATAQAQAQADLSVPGTKAADAP